jgi:hypothetical protein
VRLTPPGTSNVTIAEGGNDAAVLAAVADGEAISQNPLLVYAALAGYDGSTLDMIRALGDNADAVAVAGDGRLANLARLIGFNGTAYDRIRSEGNDRDGITALALGVLEVLASNHDFNNSTWDRHRSNFSVVAHASGAETSSADSGTLTNYNAAGVMLQTEITAVSGGSPSMKQQIQAVPPSAGGDVIGIGESRALVGATTNILACYPGVTGLVFSAQNPTLIDGVGMPVPRAWRARWSITGTSPSFTFTSDADYIP